MLNLFILRPSNKNTMSKLVSGFTFLEIMIVIAIMALLSVIVLRTLIDFKKNQALEKDTETIVQILNQAHNQTLSSKNSSVYGVHISTGTITLFTGRIYSAGASDNENFNLSSTDTILTISLTGGGSDVIFERLSGETLDDGTIVVSSPGLSKTKTVTIYKTGLVRSQ